MPLSVPLYRLECGANSYDWGKIGTSSAAAQFAAATSLDVQEDKPYAELWMGTHPSNPSKELTTGRTLLDLVETNQALLSSEVANVYGMKLPFLFKVLSIGKALSIQAHPDKKLAEKLHAEDPKNYPDDNHKPEMAIAITPFDGFCGFRPLSEIASFLKSVPTLRSLVGESAAESFIKTISGKEESSDVATVASNKAALKNLYEALMTSSEDSVKSRARELVGAIKSDPENFAGGDPLGGKAFAELISRLNDQFPEDIGLFNAFFLNYIKLQPGEAIYLKANDPHAYLSGDIMECMASSDNVVRAGFTPKFKDVKNLISMLTYSYAPISEQKMKPTPYPPSSSSSYSILYDPPIDEFAVIKTTLKSGEEEVFKGIGGPSIVIATEGQGRFSVGPKTEVVKRGYVFFVGATAELKIQADGDDEKNKLVCFRAFCELKK